MRNSNTIRPVGRAHRAFMRLLIAEKLAEIVGRVLVALLFILAGASKILGPGPFLDHMSRLGVPTGILPAVIALELGAGIALLIGWRVRGAAWALAFFCMMTALVFHHDFGISAERTLFFKDLAIAGGLLIIATSARVKTTGNGSADYFHAHTESPSQTRPNVTWRLR